MFRFRIGERIIDRETLLSGGVSDGMLDWQKEIIDFAHQWYAEPETITVNTSGTTGTPRPMELHTFQMRRSAEITADFFKLGEGTRALLCLPVKYIAGKMMIVRAMEHGWDLTCVEPGLTPLDGEEFDFVAMTPLQVEFCLAAHPKCFEKTKEVIVGGAPVSHPLRRQLRELNTAFWATYGMTETSTHVAVKKLNGPDETEYYEAIPPYQINIDGRNCLTVNFPHIVGDVIITNDRVDLVGRNQFIWLGRTDSVINSGGVKVFPEKIELVVSKFLDEPFYITSRKHDSFADQVVIVIESKPLGKARIEEFFEDCEDLLHPFEIPKDIYYEDKFARTETGKIKRKKF